MLLLVNKNNDSLHLENHMMFDYIIYYGFKNIINTKVQKEIEKYTN